MKIVSFAASNSKNSINAKLVQWVAKKFDQDIVEFIDLNDYEMPIYSTDRELENGIPTLALEFAKKIDESDLLLISFAEHNGTYTTAFKNIFDWISRIPGRKAFGEKAILAMATSTGPRGGKGVLEVAINRFPFNGGNIIGHFSLPKFNEHFDSENGITHQELNTELEQIIQNVKQIISEKSALSKTV